MKALYCLSLTVLGLPACAPLGGTGGEGRPLVNLQITEDEDLQGLDRFMSELDQRKIKATVIVDGYVATEGCNQLRAYDSTGHEIMVYGRPEEPAGETVTLTMLSYNEQKKVIGEAKAAIENCLGHVVEGFRSYRFDHNEDTWRILDEQGIRFNLSFVAFSANAPEGHENDVWPCPVEGRAFWAVPMHSVQTAGGTRAFCDRPFSSVEAEEWEQLMCDEMDRMHENGQPVKVEFHPWFSANDPERWDAFVGFLDYAEAQNAEFITVEQMLARRSDSN